jgi:hypothetical protein
MIEALNHDAYRKARDVALAVQARPNLMTGLTPDDYRAKSEEEEDADMSFIFRPVKKS